jgi:hypothetical protein
MPLLVFLAGVGVVAILGLLLLGAWIVVAGDRMDEHWPMGLDDDPPTLNTRGPQP